MTQQEQANTDLCVRVNQELFGAARLELADELFTADFVDHEAPEGSPTGSRRRAEHGQVATRGVRRHALRGRGRVRLR